MVSLRRRNGHQPDQNGGKLQPLVAVESTEQVGQQHWWRSGDYRLFNGVFEGGGAKGLLYVGALDAVRSEGFWFQRVAGTSVGSIIAALIASGLTVEQFGKELGIMLSTFPQLAGFKSYRLLRKQAGIFDPTELRERLAEVFAQQVVVQRGEERRDASTPVTFLELFEATGMELNILAIDVFERHEVVFNHRATPKCQVVDAVLASSAIPGFFPPGRLVIQRSETVRLANPIVDGGVWANFPLFVFRDERFRAFHDLDELRTPEERQVMGFLLEESQLISTGQRKARFAQPLRTAKFCGEEEVVLPAELNVLTDDATITRLVEQTSQPGFKRDTLAWEVTRTIAKGNRLTKLYGRVVHNLSRGPNPNSPELPDLSFMPGIKSPGVRALRTTSQLLRGPFAFLFVLGGVLLIAVGCLAIGRWSYDHRADILTFNLAMFAGPWLPYLIGSLALTVIVVAGAVATLAGNFYFGRASSRYGYLIASTLAAAGSVRYWMDGDSVADPETRLPLTTIIRIPVPEDLRTLSFRYVNIHFAIALARASVTEQIHYLKALRVRSDDGQETREERAVETGNVYP